MFPELPEGSHPEAGWGLGWGGCSIPLSSLQMDRFAQPIPAFGVVGSGVPVWWTPALYKASSGNTVPSEQVVYVVRVPPRLLL